MPPMRPGSRCVPSFSVGYSATVTGPLAHKVGKLKQTEQLSGPIMVVWRWWRRYPCVDADVKSIKEMKMTMLG